MTQLPVEDPVHIDKVRMTDEFFGRALSSSTQDVDDPPSCWNCCSAAASSGAMTLAVVPRHADGAPRHCVFCSLECCTQGWPRVRTQYALILYHES